jgi:hypothetical protein
MNEENLKKLYQTLSNDNFDLPSYEQFATDMQDDGKRTRLYGNIKSDYDLPDFDTFTNDMGVKKKGASSNVAQNGGEDGSAVSAQQPVPSEKSGATSDPTQQEIDRLQSKYESALNTNSNFLTPQENQQLISLKKQKQGEKDQSYKKDQDKYINEKILSRSTPVDVKKQLIALDQEYIRLSKEMNSYSERAKTDGNAKASQDQLKAEMQDIRNKQSRLVGGGDLVTKELKAVEEMKARDKSFLETAELYGKDVKFLTPEQEQELFPAKEAVDGLPSEEDTKKLIEDRYAKDDNGNVIKDNNGNPVIDYYNSIGQSLYGKDRDKYATFLGMDPKSPEVRKMSVMDLNEMVDKKRIEAQNFQTSSQEAMSTGNLGNLIDNKNFAKDLFQVDEALKGMDSEYRSIEDQALEYWKRHDINKYNATIGRLEEIRAYAGELPTYTTSVSGTKISVPDQQWLENFRKEAVSLKVNAERVKLDYLDSNYNWNGYIKESNSIKDQINSLQKEIEEKSGPLQKVNAERLNVHKELSKQISAIQTRLDAMNKELSQYVDKDFVLNDPKNEARANELIANINALSDEYNTLLQQNGSLYDESGKLKPAEGSAALQPLYDKYNELNSKNSALMNKYGITEDVRNQYDASLKFLSNSSFAMAGSERFAGSKEQEWIKKGIEMKKKDDLLNGNAFDKAYWLGVDFSRGFLNAIVPILQVPDAVAEGLGSTGRGWTDELGDWTTKFTDTIDASAKNPEGIPLWYTYLSHTAEGMGSALAYATTAELTGGVGTVLGATAKTAIALKNASTFTTAFLGSYNQNYRDAIDAGMSRGEAMASASFLSGVAGGTSLVLPDYKLIGTAQRVSFVSAVKNLGFTEGVKKWAPTYTAQMAQSFLQEGTEGASEYLTDNITKASINKLTGEEKYSDLFNPGDLVESFLMEGNVGFVMEGMKVGHTYRSPVTESAARAFAEMTPEQKSKFLVNADEQTIAELEKLNKLRLDEIASSLTNLPSYQTLSEERKDRVFSLTQERKMILDAAKEAGQLDLSITKDQIAEIDGMIVGVYEAQKVSNQVSAEGAVVENGVVNEVVEPVDGAAPTPAALDVPDTGTAVMQGLVTTVYPTVGKVETMMDGEEFVNDEDIAKAEDNLYTLLDDIDKREDLTDEQKLNMSKVIEDRLIKIQDYEYRSKTKSSTATQARPAGTIEKARAANERAANPVRTAAAEGITVAYNGMKGTMKMSDGKMVDNVGDTIPEGNYVFIPEGTNNRAGRKGAVVVGSQEDIDSNAEFVNTESNPSWAPDQNNVANMKLPNGDTLSIMDDDLSVDVGLKAAEQTIGLAPQAMFDTVFEEVSKEFNVEQPYLKSDDQKNKQGVPGGVGGQQAPIQDQSNQGTGTEATTTGGVVQGQQEVDFDGAPTITIEEETDNAAAYDNAMASVVEFDDTLEGDDLDTATAFVQSGATPEEAVRIVRDEKEAMEQASQPDTMDTSSSQQERKFSEDKLALSGLAGGFKPITRNAFDVRSSAVQDHINMQKSFAVVVEKNGKKYVMVGLRLKTEREAKTSGRDNYSFATYELDENTPSNIVELLEQKAKENFKNIYADFSSSDVIKPITTTEPFTIPKAVETPKPVAERTTTRPGEYTPSRKAELKEKYKGKPGMAMLEYLDKAARAFRKTFSKDTPVFVFETAREMHDALVAQGRSESFDPNENGAFAYDEDGNVNGIYLNMENADAATAPHEFVHNVLLEVFGQDPEVYIKFRDKILEMFKGSNIDRLKKWAEESYNEESSPEEFMTELTAQLAVTDKELELPTTLVDKFKDIMNSVFQSVAGMNVFSDRATKKDVVEFINAMASGLAAGRAIDLQAGKRLAKERAKELAKSKPVSRAKVREQSRKSASQIAAVDAAQASAMSVDDRIMAGRLRDQIAATNPDLDFIMDNFDKIERAMVKEGKLKVNCEL